MRRRNERAIAAHPFFFVSCGGVVSLPLIVLFAMTRVTSCLVCVALMLLVLLAKPAPAQDTYETPDDKIVDILEAPDLPEMKPAPGDEWVLFLDRPNMLELEEIARPRLHLAGYRIDPETNAESVARTSRYDALTFYHLEEEREVAVDLPSEAAVDYVRWVSDERIAFAHVADDGVELWTASVDAPDAQRVTDERLNATAGNPCTGLGSGELLCEFVPSDRASAPDRPAVPERPSVQESGDNPAPVRTFQDLLESPHEADLFEHYFTAQLKRVDIDDGATEAVGEPAIFDKVHPAPDGEHLFVSRTVRPFSFLVPDRWRINDWFPREMEIWSLEGTVEHEVASLPLAEEVPVDSMRTGPRDIHWQPGEDAALVWIEVDTADTDVSERMYRMETPGAEPAEIVTLEDFYWETQWRDDGTALVTEVDRYPFRAASWTRTWIVDATGEEEPRTLWDRNLEDQEADPGSPVGGRSLVTDDDWIYLIGDGFSMEGERPFLDRLNLETEQTERLWESDADHYEYPERVVFDEGVPTRLLTTRESATNHPNYHVRDLDDENVRPITDIEDPAPQLQDVTREVITYEREDGVTLAARVLLPPDYEDGDERPALLWAYPREYADPEAASQIPDEGNRFTRLSGADPEFFLLRGYAVIENASMAIIGGELGYPDEPNDTYIEQLVMSAEAAVDAVTEKGYVDPDRIGIGGHSYGGFMTANVLAHTDRFAAGISRSAAYNRTLTPFGFQNEQRTLWEAPEVYTGMSPFMYAHQIEDPLLMLHGTDDPNPGTFPMQSERMYHALRGMGKPARLVMLGHEDHGYGARESVYHALVEMFDWFDAHVKER